MSRAALCRQEQSVKERQKQASETLESLLLEGQNRSPKGLIQIHESCINSGTFHLNSMLYHNISNSPYFLNKCAQLKGWSGLVDEIYYQVTHLEPWSLGGAKTPSTAFALLLRLLTLRCTEKEMKAMLIHTDSPYIRCIGFLYLRYAADPSTVWTWFQPYLYDQEPVKIKANVKCGEGTVGEFVRDLLTELDYYGGTRLPRFPNVVEKEIQQNLKEEARIEQRAVRHMDDRKWMDYATKIGSRVQALYGDEDNPVTWYDAIVDRVLRKDDATGIEYSRPKFVVTFPEYENTETVTLGQMDMPGVDHSRDDMKYDAPSQSGSISTHSRGENRNERDRYSQSNDHRNRNNGGRSRDRDDRNRGRDYGRDLREFNDRIRDRDQDGRNDNGYHDRNRRDKNYGDRNRRNHYDRDRGNGYDQHRNANANAKRRDRSRSRDRETVTEAKTEAPPKKTPAELAAIAQKKRKLLAKYG